MVTDMKDRREWVRMKCRARSGRTAEMKVLDISAGGTMVEYHGWSAQPGERILATLPGLEPQPATLVWAEDERAGIAFEVPLHETVLDRYVALVKG
ncbi:PilZ domain-containing protein [Aurantiacibacter poecillastricola]|uniref:PilZ domain-containing protein n=1 Tax=Aurantiacibacter poecillastricola TaxID=3064385 RepID=UPI0027400493|nr:PilZ domain-containing protein [Aurantiacibacter sp. 219JJ12-13]MDP5261169.1 PilZ domain-containing protein [Aurantiacibacter sp. 219JJ12-13]